jgi:hypothetical protein
VRAGARDPVQLLGVAAEEDAVLQHGARVQQDEVVQVVLAVATTSEELR